MTSTGGGSGSAAGVSQTPPSQTFSAPVSAAVTGSQARSGADYETQDKVIYTWAGMGPPSLLSLTFTVSASASFASQGGASGYANSSASVTSPVNLSVSAQDPNPSGYPTQATQKYTFNNGSFTQSFIVDAAAATYGNASGSGGDSYNGAASAQVQWGP